MGWAEDSCIRSYFANVRYLEKKPCDTSLKQGFDPWAHPPTLFQNREYSKTRVRTVNDVLSCRSKQTFAMLVGFDW